MNVAKKLTSAWWAYRALLAQFKTGEQLAAALENTSTPVYTCMQISNVFKFIFSSFCFEYVGIMLWCLTDKIVKLRCSFAVEKHK